MAEIAYTIAAPELKKYTVTWTAVTESDTFETFTFVDLPQDISIHVSSTFGSSTTVFKVANNASTGVSGTDLSGNTVSLTAEGLTSLRERPLTIKPTSSGGSSQSLIVNMVVWL